MLGNKKVYLSVSIFIIISVLFISIKNNKAKADALSVSNDKVLYGQAWIPNLGPMSFNNCTDPTVSSTCTTPAYQVKVATDGTLNGWAWIDYSGDLDSTDHTGSWVCFGSACSPALATPAKVKLDSSTNIITGSGQISGLARAINGTDKTTSSWNGWDGIISLGDSSNSYYGVTALAATNSSTTSTQKFSNYAWGSAVVGSVDFGPVSIVSNAVKPTIFIKANGSSSTTITPSSTATLSWGLLTGNIVSCTASGDWTGTPAISGSQSTASLVSSRTYTYTLVCKSAIGLSSDPVSATVNVACSTGKFNSGGSCVSTCPSGQTGPNGICVCSIAGQSIVNGSCVCTPGFLSKGACVTACPTGQIGLNGNCACPTGQKMNSSGNCIHNLPTYIEN